MQLPTLHNIASPEQAFGTLSTLVESNAATTGFDKAILGAPYQVAVAAIGLVYIVILVRYWDFLRYFTLSAIGFKGTKRDKAHINPGEQTNIEVVMFILGLILSALCAVRIVGLWYPHLLDGIEPQNVFWSIGGLVVVVVVLLFCFQFGVTFLASIVCQRPDIGRNLIISKLLYVAVGLVVITPFTLPFLLSTHPVAMVGLWSMIVLLAVCAIIFVKETFFFFVSQKISILHWFLYLCALEIFPLSLILAPILR